MSIVPGRDVPAVPEGWVDAVNAAINDANHDDLCHCDLWPDACKSYTPGQWDMGVDLTIEIGVLTPLIRAQVAEELAESTRLRSMSFRDGKLDMELETAHEIMAALVSSARTILADAENYTELEFEVKSAESLDRYAVTVQRPGKLTPHQARLNAERDRDDWRRAAEAEVQGGVERLAVARSFRLASPSTAVDPTVHTPERVFAYLMARGWQPRPKDRYLWDSADGQQTVHVHPVATASDYTKRTGLLVSDLASIYKTGELQVLADISETEAPDA